MKISFIVPVYKVEKFLRQCVESVVFQSYKEKEIILVDDGSPDNSPELCDKLASEYDCVTVIHKENGGLSDARNIGLKEASGDYVVFVDGDDFWRSTDALDILVSNVTENPNLDFVGFNCSYYYPDSDRFSPWVEYDYDLSNPIPGNIAIQKLVTSGTVPMSACLKLIKRELLINHNITFEKGQIHEDIPWFINLLEKSNSCLFLNEYIYAYRQNVVGSITNSINEKGFNCLLDIVKNEYYKLESRKFSQESKDSIKSFLAYELGILMMEVHLLPEEKRAKARSEIKSLSGLLKYTQNPKTKLVSCVYSIFGFTITEYVLRAYNWYRCKKGNF